MTTELTCPHCGKASKLIPISSSQQQPRRKGLFQSSSSTFPEQPGFEIVEERSFWASDAVNYILTAGFVGAVGVGFSWWYGLSAGGWVAVSMLVVVVGLPILKIWLHAPPSLPKPDEPTTIKIEQQSEDKQHWLLAELDFIYPAKFYRVMREVNKQQKWTRQLTTRHGLSQGQHTKLQEKFIELNYLKPLPNDAKGYYITGVGRMAFRQILAFGGEVPQATKEKKRMTEHQVEKGSGKSNW
jgi:hypothetical protein